MVEGIEAIRCSFDSSDLSLIGESGYEVANRLDIPCEGRSCCSIAFDIGAKLLLDREEIGRCTPYQLEETARNWVDVDDYRRRDTLKLLAVAGDRKAKEEGEIFVSGRDPSANLSDTEKLIADYLRGNPGKLAKEIAAEIDRSHDSVRKALSLSGRLRKRMKIINVPGCGYYISEGDIL